MLDSSKSPSLASGGSSFSMRFLEWYWLYVSVPSLPANFQIISGPPGCSGANCVLKDQSFFFTCHHVRYIRHTHSPWTDHTLCH